MQRRLRFWTAALGLVAAALCLTVTAAEQKDAPDTKVTAPKKTDEPKKEEAEEKFVLEGPIVVKLEEVPACGKEKIGDSTRFRYPGGQYVRCTTEPSKQVKAYPKLKSKKPLYGSVMLDGSYYDPGVGTRYYFVLDESGEAQKPAKPEKEKKEPAAKEKGQAAAKTDKKTAPAIESFLIRRPPEMSSTYDRLYFDLNGDLDLTNDGVLGPAEKPPFEGLPAGTSYRFFEDLVVSLDLGPPLGKRPFAIVPRVRAYAPGLGYVYFVPKTARRGEVRLAGDEYTVYLTQSQIISGRYDRPFVQLELFPAARSSRRTIPLTPGWLGTMRLIDGQLVKVSATPLGDQLTVEPYPGDLGTLEVGSGGRAVTKLGVAGDFASRTAMVTAGDRMLLLSAEPPRRVELPVGDYMPTSLNVRHGDLRFTCRVLRDTSAETGDQPPKPLPCGIKIRKDKPFLLEFSGKPSVVFMDPGKGQSFKPGDTVRIRAMLAEPSQGIMITGLWDCREKVGERKLRTGTETITMPNYAKLVPAIVIRNAKGEEIATGKMPFG